MESAVQGCARDLFGRDRDVTRDVNVRDRDETETLHVAETFGEKQ